MLSYYLLEFKKTKTIILYKLNKKNYIVLKIYKLIVLLNTLKKHWKSTKKTDDFKTYSYNREI